MVILGIDPGFTSLGWALLDFSKARPRCVGAGVIRTKSDPKFKRCDDNKRRIGILASELAKLNKEHEPIVIAAEAQSWTRFQKADRAVAMAWGCLAALAEVWGCPVLQFRPQEIKAPLCNDSSASKKAVQTQIEANVQDAAVHLAKIRKTQVNHAADALGAAYTALGHDVCQMVIGIRDEYNRRQTIGGK